MRPASLWAEIQDAAWEPPLGAVQGAVRALAWDTVWRPVEDRAWGAVWDAVQLAVQEDLP